MHSFDFSPLFRTTVGFDRMARALDTLADEPTSSFPPYNIELTGENVYRITMAVAGFGENDIDITAQDETLIVSGRINRIGEAEERKFLHRGIAERAFERRFNLAEHVVVTNAALEMASFISHSSAKSRKRRSRKDRDLRQCKGPGEPSGLTN